MSSRKDSPPEIICMRKLKDLALDHIPKDHPLRDVILAERDEITQAEFLAKMEIWLTQLEWKEKGS